MPNNHKSLKLLFADIANAIRRKARTTAPIKADDFPTAIDEIQFNNDNGVHFLDYDGSEVEFWSITDVASKSLLPDNPTHDKLNGQGWNWTLSSIKNYASEYPTSNIYVGQMYETTSDLTEFDIVLTNSDYLTFTCNMDGLKNWGDGTQPDDLSTHTYAEVGKYTITCDGTTIPLKNFIEDRSMGYEISYPYSYCAHIRVGGSVTTIDQGAFSGCFNLQTISLTSTIEEIGGHPFTDCQRLESVVIPDHITIMDENAFSGCVNLKSISLPQELQEVGEYCFSGCYSLSNITLPRTLRLIDDFAFENCYSISALTLPNSVEEMGQGAFFNCISLDSIIIPKNVTKIPYGAFSMCTNLSSVIIPNGVQTIEYGAFENCVSLTTINLPDSISLIEEAAFAVCMSLLTINIPDGITSIEYNMFTVRTSLSKVVFPSSIEYIRSGSFEMCSEVTLYDFSSAVSIPYLEDDQVFETINDKCTILVPSELCEAWKNETNWAKYTTHISDHIIDFAEIME